MLRLENVTKIFNQGTANEKVALNNISLEVNDGDFITIIGSNGAGKSTLFNAISGSFFIDEGAISLDDKDMTYLSEHQRAKAIGRLFQDPLMGTASQMTIEENLALAYLRSNKTSPFSIITKKDRAFFKEQLSKLHMGLEDRLDMPVALLSGGQRQALTLLMATIVPPKLLLLDEHTAALDPESANTVIELTQQIISEHHLTCLMITHSMQTALEVGNRTLMMRDGKIIFDVTGEKRKQMSVQDLLNQFKKDLDNDRILLDI